MWCQKSNCEDVNNHLVSNVIPYMHANTHIYSVGKASKNGTRVGLLIQHGWEQKSINDRI